MPDVKAPQTDDPTSPDEESWEIRLRKARESSAPDFLRSDPRDYFYYTSLLASLLNFWLCPNCPRTRETKAEPDSLSHFGYQAFFSPESAQNLAKESPNHLNPKIIGTKYPDIRTCEAQPVAYFMNPAWAITCQNEDCAYSREEDDNKSPFVQDALRPRIVKENGNELIKATKGHRYCPACCISVMEYERLGKAKDRMALDYKGRLDAALEGETMTQIAGGLWGVGMGVLAYKNIWHLSPADVEPFGRCTNTTTESGKMCGYVFGRGFFFEKKADEKHNPGRSLVFKQKPGALNGLEKLWKPIEAERT